MKLATIVLFVLLHLANAKENSPNVTHRDVVASRLPEELKGFVRNRHAIKGLNHDQQKVLRLELMKLEEQLPPLGRIEVGELYLELELPLDALRVSEKLKLDVLSRTKGYLIAAKAHYQIGDFEAASTEARLVAKLDPRQIEAVAIVKSSEGRAKPQAQIKSHKVLTHTKLNQKIAPTTTIGSGLKISPVPNSKNEQKSSPRSFFSRFWAGQILSANKEQAFHYETALRLYRGRSMRKLIHQNDEGLKYRTGPADPGRYIVDPANESQVIDMRHFLGFGSMPVFAETLGFCWEIGQFFAEKSSEEPPKDPSAFLPQDFYSNALGKEFFATYDWNKEPEDQLREFFKKRKELAE